MIHINHENLLDLKYLASGVFDPLYGFMNYEEFKSVVYDMKLLNDNIWTLPITLEVNDDYNIGSTQDLYYNQTLIGKIHIEDKFQIQDKDLFEIFQTKDLNHPGIKKEKSKSSLKIAGKIQIKEELLKNTLYKGMLQDVFSKKNKEVKTIAGFQTRNAIHRAHEHLQKIALELCDALFINPLIGWKKQGDFTQEAVMSAYKVMFDEFYPQHRVFIQGLETNMRYAGPKEAIFHAIVRKNIGCTHFIIGRDHAGVGDYYGVYDAHKLAKELNSTNKLGIELLLLKEPYFCTKCDQIVSEKVCSHENTHKISISGTKIRQALVSGKIPDERFMRKEVAKALIDLGMDNIFIKE
ncbi:sulfate adenylyltransferase [Campylobacter volucris]|uniref:sulfate adenylyltransferase n=1 Tax=Campylobacter volucris TaxID=1031542 RepID=UPI0018A027BA|nr:sulfate adenylyltransferase [Campylobacter volucris]MBF7043640.1 sulfate adenylyltransferase [Campylobacter volucris]